ncbi:MAG: MoxR family ATPase [Thermaerobacter sp.]|nr:MoxR family ATPase [Thermaerobacter sp.]
MSEEVCVIAEGLAWAKILRDGRYLATDNIMLMLELAVEMGRPLLLEGPSGSGKTALAEAIAQGTGKPLIRLSCYEGLGASEALYDWNYHAQWAHLTQNQATDPFSDEFLLARPLLQAIQEPDSVLLIDEVDRADEAFEAMLLEYLSAFQISIPERGTLKATHAPITVLTSNRQRPLSDALRRRCLYIFLDWPDAQREETVVRFHVPELQSTLVEPLVGAVRRLRTWNLLKAPGLSESIDWARAAAIQRISRWGRRWVEQSLGLVVKDALDLQRVLERLDELVEPET